MSIKKHILVLLENKRGQSISGEYIAEQLNVSRNAVWKAIKGLEKDGYKINAVTNRGYTLCEDNDILSVQGMLPFLSQKKISKNIIVYDSLESTNKIAKEMAISGAEHGTIIVADCQTAGKGRYGRNFFSPPGQGIYMSIILRPGQLWFNTPTLVTAFAAVSVCEAIEAILDKTPQIKWVNDICLDSKKICGILTEAITDFESGNIQWVVVGIGINFNTSSFPEDLQQIAGAIFTDGNPSTTRNHLASEIINRMVISEYLPGSQKLLEQYRKRLMMLGEKVLVSSPKENYEAIAVSVDEIGRLIVKKCTGEIVALSSGEISVKMS